MYVAPLPPSLPPSLPPPPLFPSPYFFFFLISHSEPLTSSFLRKPNPPSLPPYQVLTHQQLTSEVLSQLAFFRPNPKVVKQRIHALIDR